MNIVWLRRELRIEDNRVIFEAMKYGDFVPIFIFDQEILHRFNRRDDERVTFLARCIEKLDEEFSKANKSLQVFFGKPKEVFKNLLEEYSILHLFVAEDFEQTSIERDKKISELVEKKGGKVIKVLDHLLLHPSQVLKSDGLPYTVFTPYSKSFRLKLASENIDLVKVKLPKSEKMRLLKNRIKYSDAKNLVEQMGYKYKENGRFPIDDANRRFMEFCRNKLLDYKIERDFPSHKGTSELSPYIRFGLISIRKLYLGAAENFSWINELIWREFYAMILYHFPNTISEEFVVKYRGTIPWENDEKKIEKFVKGETGYPIVDAAMRELITTNYMHNRTRMIVASFLTKHLLTDWRIGEEHFAQYLMDYELASNVGGWQWSASTGTDASPYFRIFNPFLQSMKFDPEGEYIRIYVDELKDHSDKSIHRPESGYFKPIVTHEQVKTKVLKAFKI